MTTLDLTTEEGKAELQKLIDKETEGLKSKNSELLGEIKKQKDSFKSIQDQLDEIKEAKEKAEQEAAEKSGDVEQIKENLQKQHQKELEKIKAELEQKSGLLNQTLIDNGLKSALVKANIAPQHLEAVEALIRMKTKAEITDKDGQAVATLDGVPISEFVEAWSQGDTGKHYIAAPKNEGGGANGSNSGGKAATARKAEMSVKEKTAFIREKTLSGESGSKAYNKLA